MLFFRRILNVDLWNPDFKGLHDVSESRSRMLLKRSFAEIK